MKTKILGLALILSMLLAACSGGEESSMPEADQSAMAEVSAEASNEESTESNVSEETSEDESAESSIAEDEPSTEPDAPANQNLLTGLADLSEEGIGKRPVAIMVNNIPAAMPQYGIDKADVVFEIPVEGYQTRLMCIFADYTKIPQVCSVRSCRKYFPAIALGFDAVYVNCGQNKAINDYVNSLGITQYDGGKDKNGIFVRDQERLNAGYAVEHTLYFDAPRFPEILEKDGVDMNLSEDKTGTAFKFAPMGEEITPNGEACVDVFVDFGSCEAGFKYNEETKTYFKTYWDKNENGLLPQCDGKSGKQFEFKNLIVLHNDYALDDSAVYDPARNRKHRLIDWKGGKDCEAYYISNGVKQQIYWEKDSEQSYMKFFDMEGNELAINRGKTYICFNEMDDVEFK
ncbi:MAG: DUF3048 domain-containing protein [Ruminococcaceae bacterium]|nr:DUF3048 domain-containing protein [Oscillospiraceae bacterium]